MREVTATNTSAAVVRWQLQSLQHAPGNARRLPNPRQSLLLQCCIFGAPHKCVVVEVEVGCQCRDGVTQAERLLTPFCMTTGVSDFEVDLTEPRQAVALPEVAVASGLLVEVQ